MYPKGNFNLKITQKSEDNINFNVLLNLIFVWQSTFKIFLAHVTYIPSLSLALEYNGKQHYHDFFFFGLTAKEYEVRDKAKQKACKKAKYELNY